MSRKPKLKFCSSCLDSMLFIRKWLLLNSLLTILVPPTIWTTFKFWYWSAKTAKMPNMTFDKNYTKTTKPHYPHSTRHAYVWLSVYCRKTYLTHNFVQSVQNEHNKKLWFTHEMDAQNRAFCWEKLKSATVSNLSLLQQDLSLLTFYIYKHLVIASVS